MRLLEGSAGQIDLPCRSGWQSHAVPDRWRWAQATSERAGTAFAQLSRNLPASFRRSPIATQRYHWQAKGRSTYCWRCCWTHCGNSSYRLWRFLHRVVRLARLPRRPAGAADHWQRLHAQPRQSSAGGL